MNKDFLVSPKDEAWSFDEIEYIKDVLYATDCTDSQLKSKLQLLSSSLENHRSDMAVFFMPESTFSIFSMLNGMRPVCEVQLNDVSNIRDALSADCTSPEVIKQHLLKKTITLFNFMKEGNLVKPVTIADDGLIKIQDIK